MKPSYLFPLILFFSSSCGYQAIRYSESCNKRISVPYIENDANGDFTAAVIHAISTSGGFEYCSTGGDLILQIRALDTQNEDIGFRYDRKKNGKLRHTMIPVERRTCALAEITLIDSNSGCTLLGPARLSSAVDYDHDYFNSRNGINVFSLGQLTDIDAAQEDIQYSLNRALAQKIADYIRFALP